MTGALATIEAPATPAAPIRHLEYGCSLHPDGPEIIVLFDDGACYRMRPTDLDDDGVVIWETEIGAFPTAQDAFLAVVRDHQVLLLVSQLTEEAAA